MALQYVGGRTGNKAGATSGNTTVQLDSGLTGGIANSVAPGDLVIVAFATGSAADRTLAITDPSAAAYTLVGSELYADGSTTDANLRVAYKFMPATADASLSIGPSGNAADGAAWAVQVWRGVDPTTPLDGVTPTTATGTATARPNPPSITPATSGAKVVVAAASATATGTTALTYASSLGLLQDNGVDTNDGRASLAYYDWTSGALDPAASSTGANNAGDSWASLSLVLRPSTGTRTAVSYQSFVNTGTGDAGPTFNKPSGVVSGDLMLAFVIAGADALTITPPSGWTMIGTSYSFGNTGQKQTVAAFWKIAGGSEGASYTWSHDGGSIYESASCCRFSTGTFDPTTPIDAYSFQSSNTATTTRTHTGLTTTVVDCAIALWSSSWAGTPTAGSAPLGFQDLGTFDAMNRNYVREYVLAGATGALNSAQASDDYVSVAVAIRSKSNGDSLTATGITASPTVGAPAITQVHAITASGIAPAAPAVGAPAITQAHSLTATEISAGAPVVGSPALTQVDNLTATGIATTAPSTGSPAIGQVHVATATGLSTTAPSVGSPSLTQAHALAATGITASPTVGSPAIAQAHGLTASPIATGAPSVGSPALTQAHALTASAIATGAPSVGAPTLAEEGALVALPLDVGTPTVGTPGLTQRHALAATGISAAPTVGAPAITQNYALAGAGIAAGAPSVGSPAIGQRHAFTAPGIATGAPATGSPAIAQAHGLTATGIATAAPSVGSPAIGNSTPFPVINLSTGAPSVGAPALAQVHALAPIGISAGSPSTGAPDLTQRHTLAATDLSTLAPSVGSPALTGGVTHDLVALGLVAGPPTVGSPALDFILLYSRDRTVRVAAEPRTISVAAEPRTLTVPAGGSWTIRVQVDTP